MIKSNILSKDNKANITLLSVKIDELVIELQRLNYWQLERPADDCFISDAPFNIDKMTFATWLQWVFIAQIKLMLTNPDFVVFNNESNVYIMASHVFATYRENTDYLCELIKEIDLIINKFSAQVYH